MKPPVLAVVGWALATLLCIGLVLRPHEPYQFGGATDDAKYFLLARSLVEGAPYGASVGSQTVRAPYPFGLPLLIAPFAALVPGDPGAGRALSFAATLLNVSLLVWGWPLLSDLRWRGWAVVAAALYAVAPVVVIETQMLSADPVFTSMALIALLICESCARSRRMSPLAGVALGFALTAAVFTRTAGVVLVPAVLLRLWWRRPVPRLPGAAALVAGAALLVVPVLTLTSVRSRDLLPTFYGESFRDPTIRGNDPAELSLVVRSARGVQTYASSTIRELVLPIGGGKEEAAVGQRISLPQLPTVTGLAVTALIVAGAIWSIRGALAPSILLFEVCHFAILLGWHYRSARLLYPLLPFLALQFLWGIRLCARALLRLTAGRPRWLPGAMVAIAALLLGCAGVYKSALNTNLQTRKVVRDFRMGTDWLRQNTAPTDAVLADEPATIHIYADRPVVPLEPLGSEGELAELVLRSGARYVLLAPRLAWDDEGKRRYDPHTAAVLAPLLESLAARGRLTLVYESPPEELVRVYRVEP